MALGYNDHWAGVALLPSVCASLAPCHNMMEHQKDVTNDSTTTTTVEEQPAQGQSDELVLHLQPPAGTSNEQHVRWTQDTVDNENLNKKKSKCCCIFTKKAEWNEGDDDDDECCESEHCRGHVEKRKPPGPENGGDEGDGAPGPHEN